MTPGENGGISAIVVNFNAAEHLAGCVRSLRAEGVAEVIVADNGSTDSSRQALAAADPAAVFLPTGGNLGYGGGANRAASVARGRLLLVCNPDIVLEPGCTSALVAALDTDPELGLVGPRIVDAEGDVYPSPRRFPGVGVALGHAFLGLVAPRNRYTRRYRMLDWDRAQFRTADWVSGACFLVRRPAWDALGGFDEAYFMYVEDVDLCWRAWRAGWKVGFEPAAGVVHAHGASTDQAPYRMIVQHHRSLLRFFWRSSRPAERPLVPLVALGLAVRAVLACAQRRAQVARAR